MVDFCSAYRTVPESPGHPAPCYFSQQHRMCVCKFITERCRIFTSRTSLHHLAPRGVICAAVDYGVSVRRIVLRVDARVAGGFPPGLPFVSIRLGPMERLEFIKHTTTCTPLAPPSPRSPTESLTAFITPEPTSRARLRATDRPGGEEVERWPGEEVTEVNQGSAHLG
ncbi:hypothetical protein Aduo_011866 [Ancylostoma duodenale]